MTPRFGSRAWTFGLLGCLVLGTLGLGVSHARPPNCITYIEDNFDGENGGSTQYDFRGWRNWSVVNPPTSLVGRGGFDPHPGHGLYVLLHDYPLGQGSGGLQSLFAFGPGAAQFYLEFKLASTTRTPWTGHAIVSFGSYAEQFDMPGQSGFVAHSRDLQIVTATETRLQFISWEPTLYLDDVVLCLAV